MLSWSRWRIKPCTSRDPVHDVFFFFSQTDNGHCIYYHQLLLCCENYSLALVWSQNISENIVLIKSIRLSLHSRKICYTVRPLVPDISRMAPHLHRNNAAENERQFVYIDTRSRLKKYSSHVPAKLRPKVRTVQLDNVESNESWRFEQSFLTVFILKIS